MPENQKLIVKNKIEGVPQELKMDAQLLVRPRPNKKFLGIFRLNMWLYLVNTKRNESRFSESVRKTIGEPPALYDTLTQEQVQQALSALLFNNGYFQNEVMFTQRLMGKRQNKLAITYKIFTHKPYAVGSYSFQDSMHLVSPLIETTMQNKLILEGSNYSAANLEAERSRITNYLRNRGYFYFNRDFLYFEVDTNLGNHKVDIVLKLKEPQENYYYKPFYLETIRINSAFSLFEEPNLGNLDTTYVNQIEVITLKEPVIKPAVLLKRLAILPGEYYALQKIQNTQNRLNDLGVWSYLSIRQNPNLTDTLGGGMSVEILLSPSPRRELEASFETSTNAIAALGIAGFLGLKNKNLFGGGEQFSLRVNGGIESQRINDVSSERTTQLPFNTFEYGALISLQIPDFVFPFRKLNKDDRLVPSTSFLASYNQQNRFDYQRAISTIRFGYEWSNRARESFAFYPFEINLATTPRIDQKLKQTIEELQDPYLAFSFTDHLTTSSRLVYTVNRLSNIKLNKQYFLRIGLESAGNLVNLIQPWLYSNQQSFPRKFLNLPYFHYLRTDIEYRRYFQFKPQQVLATRLFIGLGVPLSNSTTLPLEKRFFAGGNNSIRAWFARSVGVGAYNNYTARRIDQFGELRIEVNLEERFDIIGKLKGAIFLDMGNIWATKDTVGIRKDFSNFKWESFYKELAIGSGFGLRMDFSYFIIRVDLGLKLHDPAFNPENRWVINNIFNKEWRSTNWKTQLNGVQSEGLPNYQFLNLNLGIGFPF